MQLFCCISTARTGYEVTSPILALSTPTVGWQPKLEICTPHHGDFCSCPSAISCSRTSLTEQRTFCHFHENSFGLTSDICESRNEHNQCSFSPNPCSSREPGLHFPCQMCSLWHPQLHCPNLLGRANSIGGCSRPRVSCHLCQSSTGTEINERGLYF